MRLIDADELIKKFKRLRYNDNSYIRTKLITETLHNLVPEVIAEQPTIEAEPVKRGQWIHHAGMNSKCSCCGRYFPVAEFEQRPFDVNFCIHCGARMDGGDENA